MSEHLCRGEGLTILLVNVLVIDLVLNGGLHAESASHSALHVVGHAISFVGNQLALDEVNIALLARVLRAAVVLLYALVRVQLGGLVVDRFIVACLAWIRVVRVSAVQVELDSCAWVAPRRLIPGPKLEFSVLLLLVDEVHGCTGVGGGPAAS